MEIDPQIQLRIDRFKADLPVMKVPNLVHKYVTFGDCYALNPDQHFNLIIAVADYFNIHPSEVLIVGSAKLGFSIAQDKRYCPFGDQSDIDIAIVSTYLFDKIWQQVFNYWEEYENIDSFVYWSRGNDFKGYLFRGWIRPDKLPPTRVFSLGRDWFEFFRGLTQTGLYGPYNITAGLYKSWYYLEKYQSIRIKECKQDLGEL
jgi:hypothetical protein